MHSKLSIKKPIVFFDIETTGIDIINDRIIELCMIKLYPGGTKEVWYSKFNPEGRLSRPEALEKHGITDEELLNESPFSDLAPDILNFLDDSDIGGYNVLRFDLPMLCEEMIRAGLPLQHRGMKIIDSYLIYSKMEPRNLEAAYEKYTGKKLENAHSAQADIEATVEIFEKQLDCYELPSTVDEISKLTIERENDVDLSGKFKLKDDKVVFSFGKHQGKTVQEVFRQDPGYFKWMSTADNFSRETKILATKIYNKLLAENPVK